MSADPIVDEVRRIREEHAARFGYDLQKIFADLKRSEEARDVQDSPLVPPPDSEAISSGPALHRAASALRRAGRR
jgi:hypothetical protein